jgi:hypothetical protein
MYNIVVLSNQFLAHFFKGEMKANLFFKNFMVKRHFCDKQTNRIKVVQVAFSYHAASVFFFNFFALASCNTML